MALLPFLAAGYTHLPAKNNKYEYVVKKGLAYLVGKMDPGSGKLYDSKYWHYHMYSHGIAACALVEAYGMTNDAKLKVPCTESPSTTLPRVRNLKQEGGTIRRPTMVLATLRWCAGRSWRSRVR